MESGPSPVAALRKAAGALGCGPADALALALLAAGGVAALGLLWWVTPAGGAPVLPGAGRVPAAAEAGPMALTDTGDEVFVHVAGAVARPGVYRLRSGARVSDALGAAGGPLPQAVLDGVNLARPVGDGDQVFVPSQGQVAGPAAAPPGGGDHGGGGGSATRPDGRIDLNRATAAELTALPGIGPVLAERIVSHREEHGGFRSVEDLRAVSGIGEARLRALVDLVAV